MKLTFKMLASAIIAFLETTAFATTYPLTVENCGASESFNQPPARVLTIGQHETELLLALELEHEQTIAGTSVWFGQLPRELESKGNALKLRADNSPGFEAVPAQKTELVLAHYSWHVGPHGDVATRDQFEQLGIRTWISPADCNCKSVASTSNWQALSDKSVQCAGPVARPAYAIFLERSIRKLKRFGVWLVDITEGFR